MKDALVLDVLVEFGLELMAIVGPHFAALEGQLATTYSMKETALAWLCR